MHKTMLQRYIFYRDYFAFNLSLLNFLPVSFSKFLHILKKFLFLHVRSIEKHREKPTKL